MFKMYLWYVEVDYTVGYKKVLPWSPLLERLSKNKAFGLKLKLGYLKYFNFFKFETLKWKQNGRTFLLTEAGLLLRKNSWRWFSFHDLFPLGGYR